LEKLPRDAAFVDDMSTYYQIEFLRKREGLRPDLKTFVVAGGPLADYGAAPDDLAHEPVRLHQPIFIVTPGGLTGQFADALQPDGYRTEKFSLDRNRFVFECIKVQAERVGR